VAHTTTAADFATQLQGAATAALAKAGDSSITVTATLNGSGFLVIGQQHSTPGLVLSFPHPIVAQGGSGFGSRISLTPSGFTFTPGAGQSPINRSRTVQVNLDNPADPYAHPISSNVALQELGLLSTPTPFTFTHANTTPDVEFTLHILETGGGPSSVNATAGGSGTLGAGTYYYVVTAQLGSGESSPSLEVSATATGSNAITLTWNQVQG